LNKPVLLNLFKIIKLREANFLSSHSLIVFRNLHHKEIACPVSDSRFYQLAQNMQYSICSGIIEIKEKRGERL